MASSYLSAYPPFTPFVGTDLKLGPRPNPSITGTRTSDEAAFPDSSFDVVLVRLAVHNLHPRARREQAVTEAARVLRPGGGLTPFPAG